MPSTAIFGLRRARLSYACTGARAIEPGAGLTHADLSGAKLSAGGVGVGDALLDLSAEADLLIAISRGKVYAESLLSALPLELQLLIADAVGDRCDRAALALASPRLLGLAACRELPSYQGLEMSLAVHHVLGGPIDEQSLRSYASRSEATLEGCEWLAGVAAASLPQSGTRPGKPGRDAPLPIPSLQMRVAVSDTAQKWYLLQPASTFGALLRDVHLHVRTRVHYAGEEGAERMVRKSLPSGQVSHYKGEKSVERVVRIELPNDGEVMHYEGEKGEERVVRIARPGGRVSHYEGEKGAEREVRSDFPCGQVMHFEGEKGAERWVRSEQPCGQVQVGHYEGEKGAERMVRQERTCGQMWHYEGEKGAERMVRIELPLRGRWWKSEWGWQVGVARDFVSCGVLHYEGEKGEERLVRLERPSGTVSHYEGEMGAERKVRMRPSEYPAARWLTTRATRAWFVATELGVALRHRRRIAPNPR